jgi:hypothetical protein
MDKKAQGLSMNVIIIAAISLLVLIILAVMVFRAGGNVTKGTNCAGVGGQCFSAESCDQVQEEQGGLWGSDHSNDGKNGGCAEGEICCKRVVKEETP